MRRAPWFGNTFVGRASELSQLQDAIEGGARRLTIVGLGGMGKTRLAVELARRSAPSDFVVCDLSAARDADDLMCALAARVDFVVEPGASPQTQLGSWLAGQGGLIVVLDSFEHLPVAADATFAALADSAPNVTWLVTSRRVLGQPGETVVELGPLGVEGAEAAGVTLFLQRSVDARATLDAELVTRLVRQLEGIPLAIELCAARTELLSVEALLSRLSGRFALLRAPGALSRERNGTMWNTIDWSWQLLSVAERDLLAQATVFEGGFEVEAAEAIARLPAGSVPVLDVLHSLRRQSLLRTDSARRFSLFDVVREFARERLGRSDAIIAAETEHRRYFAARARALAESDGDQALAADVEKEEGNITAALLHALAAPRTVDSVADAVSAAEALGTIRQKRGASAAHDALVEAVLAAVEDLPPSARQTPRARMKRQRALSYASAGRHRLALDELELGELAAPDPTLQGSILYDACRCAISLGLARDAAEMGRRAVAIHRASGHRRLEACALTHLSMAEFEGGRRDAALPLAREALQMFEELGDRSAIAMASLRLGILQFDDAETAKALFERALAIQTELGERYNRAISLGYLAGLDHESGRLDEARRGYERTSRSFREIGDRRLEAVYIGYLGIVELQLGSLEEAGRLLETARAALETLSERHYLAVMTAALAGHRILSGRLEDAESQLREATDAMAKVQNPDLAPLVDVYRGLLDLARDDVARAEGRAERLVASRQEDVLLAMPLLTSGLQAAAQRAATWIASVDGELFQPPGAPVVSLRRRLLLARLLGRLVRQRREHPGAIVSYVELVRAGWPDERRPGSAAAKNRLKVAVNTLRRLGLTPLVQRDRGYLLDPEVTFS